MKQNVIKGYFQCGVCMKLMYEYSNLSALAVIFGNGTYFLNTPYTFGLLLVTAI